jgi:hypothetical protein
MDRVSNVLSAIKDAGLNGASRTGGFLSSTADSSVGAFKSTSLGESFFKNIGAILVVVMILLGGIIYIDLASDAKNTGVGATGAAGAAAATTEKKTIRRTEYFTRNELTRTPHRCPMDRARN